MSKKKNEIRSDWYSIYIELKEIYMSVFKWNNLPPSVNQRYLEMSLMVNTQLCFFKDKDLDAFLALKAMNSGRLDVYGEPTKVIVYGVNGYNTYVKINSPITGGDGVMIFDNQMRNSPLLRLQDYAKRIYEMERVMDINIKHQKTPRIPIASKESELSVKTFFQRVDNYEESVVVDKNMYDGKSDFNMVLAPAPYVADKIQEQKKKMWNEVLSYIGIINNNSEKNERLVANEIKVANGLALAKRNTRLQARELACEKINELFGLDVTVEVNSDILEDIMARELEGGGEFE